jgi:hypothetical protein
MSVQLNNGGTDKNLDYDNFMSGAPSGGAPGGNQGYNQGAGGGGGYQSNQGNFNNQGQGVGHSASIVTMISSDMVAFPIFTDMTMSSSIVWIERFFN